ncbi:uncharacterized protein LOC111376279 [Olea europaea var. sylvestris]|uniref:uncharacterized protein LOC111376279 n=1 Tax=Olea europaea var. sylvestris TaxID=158386 RepID=UPI000C1D73C9|nr:uncharacterized protein LOC111376279 [Olea europaea var. sylvestris]
MWVFYLISLPLTLGMVILTLKYFAGPEVPRYVFLTVGYTWFCSISIISLVPADIWTTIIGQFNGGISFFWSWSYWSTFLLTWLVVPLIQGYEDAGDFTVKERLKTSIHVNLVFYLIVGSIGLFGLILLIIMDKIGIRDILALAMAGSNTFGLVTGAFLLGFGLSEIPKSIWRNSDWTTRQKVLSHKIAKMAVKLDDAHKELSNTIVIAQATSKQMSKRDPLRPLMVVIDNMLVKMFKEDPSFKPQGGQLGENDMDYDTDEKSMATLRRHLRQAREEYYRCKSEYLTCVTQALELEDTIKNYERRNTTGWFASSVFPYFEMNTWLQRMGNIDKAVPFFGQGFNRIYPLIMVIYTIMVASNFFNRIISFFGNWKIFRLQTEADDVDGFDPSGMLILQKERMWLEQGRKVGEHVIPLARNFNGVSMDLESGDNDTDRRTVEMKVASDSNKEDMKGSTSKPSKDEASRYAESKEAISSKYAAMREHNKQASNTKPVENIAAAKVSLLNAGNSQPGNSSGIPSGLASKWASMKAGFQTFKTNIEAKKFLPLRQVEDTKLLSRGSSSESLDEIFQKLKRPAAGNGHSSDGDEDEHDIRVSGPRR